MHILIMNCSKKIKYKNNITNNLLCNQHAKQEYKKYTNQIKMKPFKEKNSATLNFDDVKMKLIMEFENKPNLLIASAVVIENQPSFKNPRMKSIASTIYDYYLIRGIIDRNITKSNIKQVKFMSPSNKLKLADVGDTKELIKLKGDETKTYKLTKSLGIKYCTEMIKHLPNWTTHFNNHKKKDDLADAFLQGVYFINNNNNNSNDDIVLSFDVGVIHMAYCLLKKDKFMINDKEVLTWSILAWNNIDLTDRNEHKCICGKKASLTNFTTMQNYYCKVHAKKHIVTCEEFSNLYTEHTHNTNCQYC